MAGRVGIEPTSVLGSKPSYPCQQSNRPMKEVITTRIPPVCCRGYSSTTIPCAALTHQPKPCPCDFQCSPRDSNSQHYGSEPQASTVGLEEQVTWSGLIRSRPRISSAKYAPDSLVAPGEVFPTHRRNFGNHAEDVRFELTRVLPQLD